jgi:hypothetical protein
MSSKNQVLASHAPSFVTPFRVPSRAGRTIEGALGGWEAGRHVS